MRKAEIKFNEHTAGFLSQDENGFHFIYEKNYLSSEKPTPVSLTLPLQEKAFDSPVLFPFFDGLIPEGWLLDIAETNWKINPRDRMEHLILHPELNKMMGEFGLKMVQEKFDVKKVNAEIVRILNLK